MVQICEGMEEPPHKKARMQNDNECDVGNQESSDQCNVSQDMFESSIDDGNDDGRF